MAPARSPAYSSGDARGKPPAGWPPDPTNNMNQHTETMNNLLNKPTQVIENDLDQLAHDTGTLLAATADMAGEQIGEARKRLASMLGRSREICDRVRDRASQSTKAADCAVHRNLYQTIAVGVGAGIVLGFLLATRNRCVCVHE